MTSRNQGQVSKDFEVSGSKIQGDCRETGIPLPVWTPLLNRAFLLDSAQYLSTKEHTQEEPLDQVESDDAHVHVLSDSSFDR